MDQAVVIEQRRTQGFAELAASHRLGVFRYTLASLRDHDAAEDVTQDCLLRAHKAWVGFRGDSSPQTWLIAIASNLICDLRRRQLYEFRSRIQRPPSTMENSIPDARSSPEEQLSARQQVKVVGKAMAEDLSPSERRVFFLRFVKEMSITEIELITGISKATIRVHLSRAARAVRRKLGQ